MSFLLKTEEGLVNIGGSSSSGDDFNYPDETAMPGDRLYVKEVGADGKPTAWTYKTLEGFNVYNTISKTEYKSYTGSLNGYNFLNASGDVEHTIYRIDASNLSIDGENKPFGIGDSMVIVSASDITDYMIIKRIDNDTVVAYDYVNRELIKTDTLLVFEKKPVTIYGFHINSNESNPSNAVTYLEEAIGLTPAFMNYSTGTFNYGSWENAFFMPRPCMLRNNGEVAYYLNPNDYSKKEDGTASDISNTSFGGNAMMEWGRDGKKIWYKIVPDTGNPNSASIYIADDRVDNDYHAYSFINNKGQYTDHFYTAIYNGSLYSNTLRSISGKTVMQSQTADNEVSYATANGDGWNTETYGDVELINILLILMGKSIDTQSVFGVGNMSGYVNNSSSNYGMLNSGTMNTRGLFWGKNASSTSDNSGVKVFGMENYWGNQFRRFAGMMVVSNHIKIKRCYGLDDNSTVATYNSTGAGYVDTGIIPSGTSGGFISKMNFASGAMIPEVASGSDSTYYADKLWFATSGGPYYALRGGICSNGSACGAFSLNLYNAASYSHWLIGSALSFRA